MLNLILIIIGLGFLISSIIWIFYVGKRKYDGHHMPDVYHESVSVFIGTFVVILILAGIGVIGNFKEIHPFLLVFQFYSNIVIFGLTFYLFSKETDSELFRNRLRVLGILIFIDLFIKITVYYLPRI